jgi:hypothetical protein
MKTRTFSTRHQGFTLVLTISLLVLLTMIALAMLTLSGITLRASGQSEAMANAKANARLALMLALGDLQKTVGPDRAITATSEILTTSGSSVAKPNTTGVWESWWDFNPNSSPAPNYSAQKTSRFRRWLVSSADTEGPQSRDFATTAWTGQTIELVGKNSLGSNSAADSAKVVAGKVPVSKNGIVQGSYAWHVADESVKARVNLYRDPSRNTTLAQKRALLAGHRPDPSVMKGADGGLLNVMPNDLTAAAFTKATESSGKITDIDQAELLDLAKGKVKQFRNDITPYSLGVLTDVRSGTLKQDLSSVFESSIVPTEFINKKLYQSTQGITGVSDPNWNTLKSYYISYRSLTSPETSPTLSISSTSGIASAVPTLFIASPVIAKVDTIFSLVARPLGEVFWVPGNVNVRDYHDFFVDMIFTPVVTLHNPYNVNIAFYKLEVSFENLPVAFNFMYQAGGSGGFVSQCVVPGEFESINTMNYDAGADHKGRTDKIFVMNIANWSDSDASSTDISGPIVMKPGQTLICGPSFPAGASFKSDSGGGHNTLGFDWDNRLTKAIKAKPSFTPGLGYEMYAVTIGHMRLPGGVYPAGWTGHPFMMLRDAGASPKISKSTVTDRFYIEFKAQRPNWYADNTTVNKGEAAPSFAVTAKIQNTSSGSLVDYAKLQFNYNDDTTLKGVFNNRVYRYPPTGSLTGSECAAPSGTPYASQGAFVHPFAIFSAYSRTTSGGVYETGQRTKNPIDSPQVNLLRDGRIAGKPFLFHNLSRSNFTMNLGTEKPGAQAYELNLQPFLSKGDYQDYMDVDASNRVPSLSGNKTTSGIKSGSYLEVPSGPMQTIADFRRSNALTTSFMPQFVQPVGNSLLHPMMFADKVVQPGIAPYNYAFLDHSVLANHALYDRFYFSTFATRGTTLPDAMFEQFMNGTAPLAVQSFMPYRPSGQTVATAKAELFTAGRQKTTSYQTVAEFQMIQGPFNVNSTSVQAWKAALGAMNKSDVSTLWARTSALESKAAVGIPIAAMSLMNGGVSRSLAIDATKIDNAKSNDWNGYRELTVAELETLAIKIVEQVRDRGPFLSMSEFVNRQIGTAGPRTLSGALESAIKEAEINEKKNAIFPNTFLAQTPITTADLSDPKLYNYTTKDATTGNPAAGAPGWVSQADLLRILEPAATVRGDTFVIRVCGESWDPSGNVIARAFAEAVVQRVPDYVDSINRPSLNVYTDTTATQTNKTFGRRINLVSFRWLASNEI